MWQYIIYIDNFFILIKLAIALKKLGFAILDICKVGFDMSKKQLMVKKVSTKQQNWGFKTITIDATSKMLCITWQNLNIL